MRKGLREVPHRLPAISDFHRNPAHEFRVDEVPSTSTHLPNSFVLTLPVVTQPCDVLQSAVLQQSQTKLAGALNAVKPIEEPDARRDCQVKDDFTEFDLPRLISLPLAPMMRSGSGDSCAPPEELSQVRR